MLKVLRQLILPALLAQTSGVVVAAESGYVDTVYGWGSWELGIEPAAGGPITQGNRNIKVNQRNPQFRPNSNGAFTGVRSGDVVMNTTGNGPTPPPTPVVPNNPPGPATPIGPNNPPLPNNPAAF